MQEGGDQYLGPCHKMNVSIITTVNHNVGDDFVREGILYLLEQQLGSFNCQLIHKHIPLTARPEWEWFYASGFSSLLDRLPRGRGLFWSKVIDHLPLNSSSDKVLNSDLLIQSGAPVYWSDAYKCEWIEPLIRKRYLKMAHRVPFINLGAGTCQHFNSDGSELLDNEHLVSYIRELYSLCTVTTVRDQLSKTVLGKLGINVPVIPCPSLFGCNRLGVVPQNPEYIALNFMRLGGHYDFEKNVDVKQWERNFVGFVNYLVGQNEKVLLVCHNHNELLEAKNILPEIPRFIASTAREYLECYARSRYFIGCRVHGAFATASLGKPAFVIGSDSRSKMLGQIGLPYEHVDKVCIDSLVDIKEYLESMRSSYTDKISIIKNEARDSYNDALAVLFDKMKINR